MTPTGDYLWLCPKHYRVYDPGLPKLPREDLPPEIGALARLLDSADQPEAAEAQSKYE